jgi:adenine-specific DNA-methyltransferase
MENIEKLFIEDIENMFAFNLTNSEKTVELDFGQYKLHRLYKPLINLYIKEFFQEIEKFEEKDREKILNIFIDFFSLYYNNWDFGYFKSKFNNYQYRVPYSGKDTEFFWATKDCYYVKTSDVVNEMQLDSMFDNEKLKLKFTKKVKASWEKQDKYDFSVEIKELFDEEWEKLWYEIIFYNWEESKVAKNSKMKQVKEVLKEYNIDYENNPWLKKAIDEFLKKWWRDYFIHKRLRNFLLEELEWYFFQILKADTENKVKILELQNKIQLLKEKYQDDKEYLNFQLWKILKEFVQETEDRDLNIYETAYSWIVNFINILSDLEELKKTLWLKPRKVKKQEYVITLWKLAEYIKEYTNNYYDDLDLEQFNKDIFEEIIKNKEQKQEWISLGMIDEKVENIFNMLWEIENKYKNLPVDTKFFEKDSKFYEFLNKLWDSKLHEEDSLLDGLLIKSENFQALNTLIKDYDWTIKTIYIDPPFNLWENGDFMYKTDYLDGSWASLLYDRIMLWKSLLDEDGSFWTRCDYHGDYIVRQIKDMIFGKDNFRNELVVNRSTQMWSTANRFPTNFDNIFWYVKNTDNYTFNKIERDRICKYCWQKKEPQWIIMHSPGLRYPPERYINWRKFLPPKWRHWTFVQSTIDKLYSKWEIMIDENIEYIDIDWNKVRGMLKYLQSSTEFIDNNWTDIAWYSSTTKFSTENSEMLLKRVIQSTSNWNDIVLDFFLWSGTTTATAQKLWRKWIWIEFWKQFEEVDIPRMKQVIYWKQNLISKDKDVNYKWWWFFKYLYLEQYDDWFNEDGYLSKIENDIKKLENMNIEQNSINDLLFVLEDVKKKIIGE